ncbi:Cyanophycin synthetase [Enhygromyxa salina]|uniref:Cyanophycin synthetase n=1 Tax=Enhygromyxa salina TaxID=215803 RepID=A0A2S9XHV7_9BACT|nr:Mur ligase family protein [Enhygromyxa salina]PRP92452.1 Cyanophycin synthetase [Enhygromyxa salina]
MGPAVELVDSRRLTGPNLHCRSAGAVVELRFGAGVDREAFIGRWREALARALTALGWTAELHARPFESPEGLRGAELMFSAAVDRLYAATEVNEWAVAVARLEAEAEPEPAAMARLAAVAAQEQAERRGALALIAAAEARGVPWLIDDDELSLGYFADSGRWPVAALPEPESLDWSRLRGRAIALITGTNGKTTTTRLLARIAARQGVRVGNTSTDGLCVDEREVESGDWTGPGGARAVLRNPAIELALLETARGGLLRRGAAVSSCAVGVVTNVASDHLGEYGIFDVEGMAMAKGIVAKIVAPGGRVVLGADSPALVAWAAAQELAAPIVWVSSEPDNPVLAEARARGGEVWTVVEGGVVRSVGLERSELCRVDEMPLSLGGLARHNVQNALAAAAAARGLGFDDAAIVAGLREFGARPEDNPGRARVWQVTRRGGETVDLLLDFAHNLAGLEAISELVRGLARRPLLCFGMAGDRGDDQLRAQARALVSFRPRRIIVRELGSHRRGRAPGEVPRILDQALRAAGLDPGAILHTESEVASLDAALELAEPGELVVVLVHTERDAVDAWLREHDARPGRLRAGT